MRTVENNSSLNEYLGEFVEDYIANNSSICTKDFIDICLDVASIYSSKYHEYLPLTNDKIWISGLIRKLNYVHLKQITYNNEFVCETVLPYSVKFLEQFFKDKKVEEYKKILEQEETQTQSLSFNSLKKVKDSSEEVKQQLEAKFEELEKSIEEVIDDIPEELLYSSAGDLSDIVEDKQDIQELMKLFKSLKFNKKSVNTFVRKSIRIFKNYFNNIIGYKRVDLLDADDFVGLENVHYIGFKIESLLEEIYVKEPKKSIVVDLYIDVSSSMSTKIKVEKQDVYLPNVCKFLAFNLLKYKYINELYVFDYYPIRIEFSELLSKDFRGGGTSIERVLQKIKEDNRPAIIITDGEDNFTTYTDLAFLFYVSEKAYNKRKADESPGFMQYLHKKQIIGYFNNKFIQE